LDQKFSVEGIQGVCRRHAGESPLDLLGHLFSTIQVSPLTASSGTT
jgi:hypothetical protein